MASPQRETQELPQMEWQLSLVHKAARMIQDVLTLIEEDRFCDSKRTTVIVLLKLLIVNVLVPEAFVHDLRHLIGDHEITSSGGLQVLAHALPLLRDQMSKACVVNGENGFNLNEQLGCYIHCTNDQGQSALAVIGSGKLESKLQLARSVEECLIHILQRISIVQQAGLLMTGGDLNANGSSLTIAPYMPESSNLVLSDILPPEVLQCALLFKDLIFCMHCSDVTTEDAILVISHMKSLLFGLTECFTFIEIVLPLVARFERFCSNLSHISLPFLFTRVPKMRKAMERHDVMINGFNINRELGVLVHNGDGPLATVSLAAGGTELRLGIEKEVFQLFLIIAQKGKRILHLKLDESPEAVKSREVRAKSNQKSTEKLVMIFRDLLATVYDERRFSDEARTNVLSHIKNLITGMIDAQMFVVRIKQILGDGNHPFDGQPRSEAYFLYRSVPVLRTIMREKELVVSGFNINEELGIFVHAVDESGQPKIIVSCEGRIQKEFGVSEKVESLVPEIADFETFRKSINRRNAQQYRDPSIVRFGETENAATANIEVISELRLSQILDHDEENEAPASKKMKRSNKSAERTSDDETLVKSANPIARLCDISLVLEPLEKRVLGRAVSSEEGSASAKSSLLLTPSNRALRISKRMMNP